MITISHAYPGGLKIELASGKCIKAENGYEISEAVKHYYEGINCPHDKGICPLCKIIREED